MSEGIKPTQETGEEIPNEELLFTVLERATEQHYCQRCQTEQGPGSGFVDRKVSTDNWRVYCEIPKTGEENILEALCTNCILDASSMGVPVVETDGKPWKGEGVFTRQPDDEQKEHLRKLKKTREALNNTEEN